MRSILGLLCVLPVTIAAFAQTPVSDLKAEYRDGQVFLTWKEAGVPEGTTFNVYLSAEPIAADNLREAKRVCQWILPHSAEDWWLDPYAFGRGPKSDPKTGKKPVYTPRGFLIREGGERLDPKSGLHVHTVAPDETGERYYAVTTFLNGKEDTALAPGANSLTRPVNQRVEPVRPIWQQELPAALKAGAGDGKPCMLNLHAKGNRRATKYLMFGDATHAWREGVPFKFDVSVSATRVDLYPSNTMYTGRPFKRARDGRNRNKIAIFCFWYGCSDRMFEQELIPEGTPTNYSERRLLTIISWAKKHLGIDPNRVYCHGGSMGGCGGMSFAFRHPEIFAAINAHVPIVAYNEGDPARGRKLGWHSNTYRLVGFCGPLSLKCSDGVTLKDRLDSRLFARSHPGDLPFLVIANGRNDASIPWHNNPDFYRALQEMRHGCMIAWNDGSHPETRKKLPPEFKRWTGFERLSRFALNKSYPAFSNCSKNGDPGNGDSTDGDVVGYMNLGLNWKDVKDTPRRYETTVFWELDPKELPLSVDVTPRRIQAFKLKPGDKCAAVNMDASGKEVQRVTLTADAHGLVTFPGFHVTSAKGNRLVLTQ